MLTGEIVGVKPTETKEIEEGDTKDALTYTYIAAELFFFRAEDGIRGLIMTGVQTCALPI